MATFSNEWQDAAKPVFHAKNDTVEDWPGDFTDLSQMNASGNTNRL